MIYAALLFAGLFFLASCQPADFDSPQRETNAVATAHSYTVSIPAVFDDGARTKAVEFEGETGITHTFKSDGSEGVHVYIPAKKALAGTPQNDPVYDNNRGEYYLPFSPSALIPSADGNHCSLEGNLTFYTCDMESCEYDAVLGYDVYGIYTPYDPSENDSFNLYYQMPQDDTYHFGSDLFGYAEAAGVHMEIDQLNGTMTLGESVSFTNVGSMFRQKLSFQNAQGQTITPTPVIKKLTITMANGATISAFNPLGEKGVSQGQLFDNRYRFAPIVLAGDNILDQNDNVFFSMMFTDANRYEAINMKAVDENGNVYTYTQAAPQNGFEDSKYYYSQNAKAFSFLANAGSAIITHSDASTTTPEPTEQYGEYVYQIDMADDDVLTLAGYWEDRKFIINGKHVVLDNLFAIRESYFMRFSGSDVNIKLKGDNRISCVNYDCALSSYNTVIMLSCEGESATLAITVNDDYWRGICCSNYNSISYDPSWLAAPGYLVTLDNNSGSNGDGTYTYTYIVSRIAQTTVDLSQQFPSTSISAFTALDGMTLTGTPGGPLKLSIAAGATVTLSGITIDGIDAFNLRWAGISCLGSATLILADGTTNNVKGFHQHYPGIYIPENETLTISGTGSLIASSNESGAGIGGYVGSSCGNIVIESGNITATGYPGIGGSGSGCGNITINGGIVKATGVQPAINGSPGIGFAGVNAVCGAISITGGEVNATGASGAPGIGAANYQAHCGDISITGGTVVSIGGEHAAGIGTGNNAICDNITIGANVTRVTARRGAKYDNNIPDVIGRDPWNQGCGTITFGTKPMFECVSEVWSWTTIPTDGGSYGGLTLAITTVAEDNDNTWTLTPTPANP